MKSDKFRIESVVNFMEHDSTSKSVIVDMILLPSESFVVQIEKEDKIRYSRVILE